MGFEPYSKNDRDDWHVKSEDGDSEVFDLEARFVPPSIPGSRSPVMARRRRRDLLVGVLAGLVMTAAITFYLITQERDRQPLALMQETPSTSPIKLTVKPAWATVTLGDEPIGPPDDFGQLQLPPLDPNNSEVYLEVSADGYKTNRKPLSAYGGVQDATVELEHNNWEVMVRSDPPGAQVWIDGRCRGLTPTTLPMPPVESASLILKRVGFLDLTQKIAPPERGEHLEVDLTLAAAGPTIRVESDPPGAEIALDGRVQGVAPLTIALDSSFLDGEVALTASLNGYRDATVNALMPAVAGPDPVQAHVVLSPMMAEVAFQTDPPGGHVILNGEDLGAAPVVATFGPADVGRSLVVQAILPGSHHGTREITVPPVGETVGMTIPMSFNAQRLVFMLSCPQELLSDGVLLKEDLVERIHRLEADQQFAILMGTHDGIESWPMQLGTKAATPEQKIRAYDVVRSARLGGSVDLGAMMQAALIFKPTTVWLYVSGDLDLTGLDDYADWAEGHDVSIHIVRASPGPEDEWLTEWVAAYQGSLSTLGEAPAPALATAGESAE